LVSIVPIWKRSLLILHWAINSSNSKFFNNPIGEMP
jgi:hypothetical protein